MTALLALPLLILLMAVGVPVAWCFAAVVAFFVWLFDVNLNTLMLFGNQWSGCIPKKLSDVPKSDFHFPDMPPFC